MNENLSNMRALKVELNIIINDMDQIRAQLTVAHIRINQVLHELEKDE